MKKKIAILGSTGSIGKTLLNIVEKDKKNFEIKLLTANQNYKLLLHQAKKFKVKNIIITDLKNYLKIKKLNKDKNINIYQDFKDLNKILNKKVFGSKKNFGLQKKICQRIFFTKNCFCQKIV